MHTADKDAIQPRWELKASKSDGSDSAPGGAQLQGPLSDLLGMRRNAPDRFIFNGCAVSPFWPLGAANEDGAELWPARAPPSHRTTPPAARAVCTVAPLSPRGWPHPPAPVAAARQNYYLRSAPNFYFNAPFPTICRNNEIQNRRKVAGYTVVQALR